MNKLSNFTFDEIEVGQTAQYVKTLEEKHLLLFAAVSGDINPVHLDEEFASQTQFGGRIAHGMWSASLISAAIATQLPGPGSVYLGQELRFKRPVKLGDELTVVLTVKEKIDKKNHLILHCEVKNQAHKIVLQGDARVIAPTTKTTVPAPTLPQISIASN